MEYDTLIHDDPSDNNQDESAAIAPGEARRAQPSQRPRGMASQDALNAIGHFQDINILRSPTVELASVSPFCAPGDMLMASALAGAGKTTIATDILIGAAHPDRHGVALGGLLRFNHGDQEYTKCAVLDAEGTLVRWCSVLHRKVQLERLDPGRLSVIRYLRSGDFQLSSTTRREEYSRNLAEALAHDRRKLVIIDTVAAVWSPAQLNDPEWVFTGLKPFREVCQRYGITIICLTHTSRKAGAEGRSFSPIGSSHQENQADALLSITRFKKHGVDGLDIVHRKSRRSFWIAQGSSVFARFTPEYGYEPTGDWPKTWPHEWTPTTADLDASGLPVRLQIEHALKQSSPNPLTAVGLARTIGASDRTVRAHLKALVHDKVALKEGSGRSTRYRCGR